MPKYSYRCNECGDAFEIFHSIKQKETDCSACAHSGSLERIPFIPLSVTKKYNNKEEKPGRLTEEFIKDATEELKQEKRELKKEVYEP